jgi:cytochrome b
MKQASVMVWDPLVRLFHWLLVTACVAAYLTRSAQYELHLITGYTVFGLILFRVLWGFVGPRHARFGDFVRSPANTWSYLRASARGRARRHLGHNPAGGAMIVALLLVLAVIVVSGIALDAAENRAGPLGGTRLFLYMDPIAAVHRFSTDVGIGLVALHLAGVIQASVAQRENLVSAMLTGRKRAPSEEDRCS